MVPLTYLAATHIIISFTYIYIQIYLIVWIDVAAEEEGISHKYKINFTYFIDTSEFTLILLISYF